MLDKSGTLATFCGEAAFASITIFNEANVQVNKTQTPVMYEIKVQIYSCKVKSRKMGFK